MTCNVALFFGSLALRSSASPYWPSPVAPGKPLPHPLRFHRDSRRPIGPSPPRSTPTSCPIALTMRSPRLRPTAGGCISSTLQLRGSGNWIPVGRIQLQQKRSGSLNITPMLGGVFGKTTGVAPGLRGSLSWWRFYFYGEGEFVITTDNVLTPFSTVGRS